MRNTGPERNGRGHATALILDQYSLWLETVKRLAERAGIGVVATTTSPQQAEEALLAREPNLFILGLESGSMGATVISELLDVAASVQGLATLVVGSDDDPELVERCLRSGVYAYVLKTVHPIDLSIAIRQTVNHSVYLFARPSQQLERRARLRSQAHYARAPGTPPRGRRAPQCAGGRAALDQRADGEVPPLTDLREAGGLEPHGCVALGRTAWVARSGRELTRPPGHSLAGASRLASLLVVCLCLVVQSAASGAAADRASRRGQRRRRAAGCAGRRRPSST